VGGVNTHTDVVPVIECSNCPKRLIPDHSFEGVMWESNCFTKLKNSPDSIHPVGLPLLSLPPGTSLRMHSGERRAGSY
jgi:hypothetical protein